MKKTLAVLISTMLLLSGCSSSNGSSDAVENMVQIH